ncbi:MAG: PD40 domain-containing protein [Solirubrobacterales bacterium]|nr:PD40 domain-containing protein [Solirubrobacterales bacterium]
MKAGTAGSKWRCALVAVAMAAGVTAAVPGVASATNPGRNGLIAFEANGSQGGGFSVVGPDGSAPREIYRDGMEPSEPAWSPNGRELAMSLFCGGQCAIALNTATWAGSVLGSPTRWAGGPVSQGPEVPPTATMWTNASWSPSGQQIVVGERSGLWVVERPTVGSDGTLVRRQRQLTNGTTDSEPAWSPDGREIAFTRCSAPGKCGIYAVSPTAVAGSPVRAVTDDRSNHHDANWAPDSSRIAFEIGTPRGTGKGIWTIRRDGRDWRQVHGSGYEPTYSPDGTRIALTKGSGLYTVKVDGTGLRLIAAGAESKNPDWQPLR